MSITRKMILTSLLAPNHEAPGGIMSHAKHVGYAMTHKALIIDTIETSLIIIFIRLKKTATFSGV